MVIGFVNLYYPQELFHNISCKRSYNATVIMCEPLDNNVQKSSNKMFRTIKILRTGLFFTVILHVSNIQCQQDAAPAAVVQAAIPGRPTWQFSAQHWKLLELRNLAVNGD